MRHRITQKGTESFCVFLCASVAHHTFAQTLRFNMNPPHTRHTDPQPIVKILWVASFSYSQLYHQIPVFAR